MRGEAVEGGMSHERDRGATARELIARYLDGVADDVDAAALDRLLTRDPKVARQLAEAARLESQLEIIARAAPAAVDRPASLSVAPLRRRRGVWVAAGTIAAVAAALALASALGTAGRADRIPGPIPPAANTSADDPARLQFADGSTAVLRDAASKLDTRLSTAAAIDLVLAQGGARFEVVPRPGRRFRIWVDSAYVEVIGTIFTVERLPAGVRVSVERGVVKVVSGQHEMRLSEGTADVVPIAPAAPPIAADAPEPARERAPAHVQKGTARAEGASDETGALLRASENARRSGHPQDALVFLRRLLDQHPRDPRAPYAAFILGRVLLEELRRPDEAASAFARVPALDAKTPLVQDALAREVESWARAGELARARERARAYLERYPNGRRADEVRRYSRME
jgi:transmembrane sensor